MNARYIRCNTLIGAFVALLTLACAAPKSSTPPEAMTGVPAANRIVVAPLNLALRVPTGVDLDTELLRAELARHFQQMDRTVQEIEPVSATRIWDESLAELTKSGAKPDLAATSQRFALGLAEHAEYDLLVMPSLLLRSGRVRGGGVYWDGVRQRLPVKSTLPFGPIDAVEPMGVRASQWGFRGRVAVVSLYVEVLTPDGRSVYQGIGGLDILQAATRDRDGSGSWELVDRTDALADRADLSRGITVAFERRLPEIAAAW